MNRSRAVVIHLLASLATALVAGWLLVRVYYPYGLLGAMGAQRAALATLTSFLVLGPALTALLYRPGKRGVAIDLALIALLQLAAAAAGGYVLWRGRPAFLVFAVDRVTVVGANELSDANLDQAREPLYGARPMLGPLFVALDKPGDEELANSILFASLQHGEDIDRYPLFYTPIERQLDALARAARDPSRIDPALAPQREELGYLPLVARERDVALLVSRHDGRIRGARDVDPW